MVELPLRDASSYSALEDRQRLAADAVAVGVEPIRIVHAGETHLVGEVAAIEIVYIGDARRVGLAT